jgi:phage shock protein A
VEDAEMKIFKELYKKLKRADKQASENMRDYVADAREAIDARKKEIAHFRVKVAEVNQAKRGLERNLNETEADVKKWSSTLERVKTSNLGLEEKKEKGLPVLKARNAAQGRADDLKKSIADQEAVLRGLRQQLVVAQSDMAEREQKLATLAARKQAATVRAGLSQASAAFSTGKSALGAVDELEEKVKAEEDRVAAFEEEASLTNTSSEAESVAAEFEAGSVNLDSELDEMFGDGNKSGAKAADEQAKGA